MKKSPRSAKALRPNASIALTKDSFQNFEARIGYGTGNVADGGSYNIDYLSRNRFRLEAMYRSSWICGKAIDSVAEDMTKRGIEINSEIDPGESDELMRVWKRLKLWDAIADTIKWSRLYGGAVAVRLIDGQNLSTPLRIETVKQDQFKGLLALDRWQLQPSLNNLIADMGPDLGLPTSYQTLGGARLLPQTKIHYSRLIRLDGQDLPYFQRIAENLWGQSVLERLLDRLLAFDSTTQGAAQLVYKAHLRTYKIEGLRDIIAAGGPILDGLAKQIDFIRQTQSNEGLTLMDAKDEFEAHSYTFSGLDTVLLQFAQQLSGALDIPLTRLFGQSPAGLNSTGESDLRTYYDGINQQQERRLRSGVEKLLRLTYQSKFGKPLKDGSDFTFRPLWQLSEVEKGTLAAQLTTAITSACTSSIVGRQTALKELRQQSKLTGVWTNISDEDIAAADNDVNAGGEFGASRTGSGDPFGEGQRSPARDGWREDDHPRAENGEFSEGGGRSSQQVQFSAQTHVGKSEASQTLQRQITEGVSKRFPQLAEHLRTAGYVKKVLIGEELFDGDGVNRSYKNAYAVAHPDGTIYFRSLPPPKSPDDKSRLWENWITVESQSDPQQAAVATFLHEAAHQYHFNDPDLWAKPGSGGKPGSNSELETLFQKARKHDRAITQNAARNPQEYFAESFVAALLHPVDLDKRDPEMGHFMKKWFAKQGIKP